MRKKGHLGAPENACVDNHVGKVVRNTHAIIGAGHARSACRFLNAFGLAKMYARG